MQIWQLVVSGLVVHIILFYSIFDIYFTSPLVHGMSPVSSPLKPPAKRLVLFVADGLRADSFFELDENGQSRAPYLRSVMEKSGSWGVSHTRVPTESRPGHVALIAGFYEDVSAVAKGWKENPVEFDSVFNQSRNTWSWGSPDILPMFAKGASGDHVFTHCYESESEDFASSDSTRLDTWVFYQVEKFLKEAKQNSTLLRKLQQDKIVFFLHLLGIDTNGHAHKPHSEEYKENIKLVDEGIGDMVTLFDRFYDSDDRTAYVMSADHGMTSWGSHGASHPSETLTPLVAWGAGVHGPRVGEDCGQYADTFCKDWNLKKLSRFDVEQADVAPLMSFLIGAAFPMNSVGVLPLQYLSASPWEQAEGIFTNAQQILNQYEVKMNQMKERTISMAFRPYSELSPSMQADYVRHIRQLIQTGNYEQAISESMRLIETALKGLNYYQKYDRLFLGLSIVLSFIGWMVYILQQVLSGHTWFTRNSADVHTLQQRKLLTYTAIGVGCLVTVLLYIQSSPYTYYLYCLLPVVLWAKVVEIELAWQILRRGLRVCYERKSSLAVTASVICSVLGLEILVQGFFYRELLSLGLVFIGLWSMTSGMLNTAKISSIGWLLSCIILAVFPMLPVVGGNTNYPLVITSGVFSLILGSVIVYSLGVLTNRDKNNNRMSGLVMGIQLVMLLLALFIVKTTSSGVRDKTGVPTYNHLISWLMLGLCPVWPLLTSTNLPERLSSIALTFLAPYVLMSITYEGLFVLSLLSVLYFWLRMEQNLCVARSRRMLSDTYFTSTNSLRSRHDSSESRHLQLADLRRAFFFVFFTLIAFFGTGNIASINSFDPSSVYCFVTVFNPFVMGAIMLLKNVIPFLLVTCAFRGVHVVTQIPVRALFLLVMLMSDFMGLHFFFLVRDYGSWLEIGTTISHYVIVMVMIIFLMLLMGISHFLTCSSLPFCQRKFHPS